MDLNGDGHEDILSGSYSRYEGSMAGLFQVLKGNADGTFATAEALKGTNDEPLIVSSSETKAGYDNDIDRICTRPVAVDWDGDSDLDLIVGNFGGTFSLFRGEGNGKFQPTSDPLMVGNDVLRITGHHADPFCIDWDKDGDIDLLSGSTNGGVQWSENTAGPKKMPELKSFVSLIEPGSQSGQGEILKESDLTGPTRSTRIWVDDVNDDGKLDILVGDCTTLVSPAEGLTEDESKKKEADWQKRIEEIQEKLVRPRNVNKADEDSEKEADKDDDAEKKSVTEADKEAMQKVISEYQALYEEREKFIKEDRTGFVWLYLQK